MMFGRAKCSPPRQTVLQHKHAKFCGRQTPNCEFLHSQSGKYPLMLCLFRKGDDRATQSPGGGVKPPSSLPTSPSASPPSEALGAFLSTWVSRPDSRFSDDGVAR